MDPLSQGLLGAGLAISSAKRRTIRMAAICGAVGGLAPDLDILIQSSSDSLLAVEYHRHFTHSLAFIPLGGLIVAAFLYLFLRKEAPFKLIYLYTTLGFATHGLLDACTSYGTRLFWPFSDARIGWNAISIVDPVFTLTLGAFLAWSLRKKAVFIMRTGLALALCYLSIGLYQRERAESFMREVAKQRGHAIERIILNPTIANHILWRSVYQSGDNFYVDAVRAPYFQMPTMKKGLTVPAVNKGTVFPSLGQRSVQRQDIWRFAYFSQGYIYMHPDYDTVIADLRYGTLPYDNRSLWGIAVDPASPDTHAQFKSLRRINKQQYGTFWTLLTRGFTEEKSQ